jgi:hypothetical protein
MLLLVGCKTTEQAYFEQEAAGNVWALSLPIGTKITVENTELLAPAFNEIHEGTLRLPCVLVSQEYLNRRDQQEIEDLALIQKLKVLKDAP